MTSAANSNITGVTPVASSIRRSSVAEKVERLQTRAQETSQSMDKTEVCNRNFSEHPALRGLEGVAYLNANGETQLISSMDKVLDVFSIDEDLWAAANGAKKRAHTCLGHPGNFHSDYADPNCDDIACRLLGGPCVLGLPIFPCCVGTTILFTLPIFWPWTVMPLALRAGGCIPHRDVPLPDRADKALVLTEKGLIGIRTDSSGSGVVAISWNGFNLHEVRIKQYSGEKDCGCCICDKMPSNWYDSTTENSNLNMEFSPLAVIMYEAGCSTGRPYLSQDPLIYALSFGIQSPCSYVICRQPKKRGLYRVVIPSAFREQAFYHYGIHVLQSKAKIELLALAKDPAYLYLALERGWRQATKGPYEEKGPLQQEIERR